MKPGGKLLGTPGPARDDRASDPHQSQLPNSPPGFGPTPHTALPPLGPKEGVLERE